MGATIKPIHVLLGGLLFFGSMTVYQSDFWAQPTPIPPESVRLANTWAVPGR